MGGKTISVEKLEEMIAKNDVQLFDVRNPDEVASGKIANATNIPLPEWGEAFKLPDAEFVAKYGVPKPRTSDTNFVTYCMRGGRGAKSVDELKALGYDKAVTLDGGILAWKAKHG